MKKGMGGLVLGAALLSAGTLVPAAPAIAAPMSKVALHGNLPKIPSDVTRMGALTSSRSLHLLVSLVGQDPSGLNEEVAAVSTPGSALYHHYLTTSQFAAAYGPAPEEVQQVTQALRSEGLAVGRMGSGSTLLPVSGSAAIVSQAFGTPLESVRLPDGASSFVNTAEPLVPASLEGEVNAVVGLDGLSQPHSMLRRAPASGSSTTGTSSGSMGLSHQLAHQLSNAEAGPQACSQATSAAGTSGYTTTQLANDYGLNQLFTQGRTGIGQTVAIVEFEQFSNSDIAAFETCEGLSTPIRIISVDGGAGGPAQGSGEAALDIELVAANAPSSSLLVYEAPNQVSGASSLSLLSQIASDDLAQVITTSWGICESDLTSGEASSESAIFSRMAAQGQTMVAAAGDAGSEDCLTSDGSAVLAIDDPGAQSDVLSAGGTSMVGGAAGAQSVWNNCGVQDDDVCQDNSSSGAGGGGYSETWAKPAWQPDSSGGTGTDPCSNQSGCRSVPDLSADADPDHGVVAYFGAAGGWTVFGGTSSVAPMLAGLFADTNQGCTTNVGLVAPALYAVDNGSNFNDVTTGSNDFTGTHNGSWKAGPGYDAASGLGTPIDQNVAIALEGGDGCPSVASISASTGPESNGPDITITGGGLADASSVNFGSAGTGRIVSASETTLVVAPPSPGENDCVTIIVSNPDGSSVGTEAERYAFGSADSCAGYRFVASDGGIFNFGSGNFYGSAGNLNLSAPIVGMAATPSGDGYWLVATDGGIFNYGDAHFYGSMGGTPLNKPIVGMASTPSGNGYWMVASDGGIFNFGGARYFGSMGGQALSKPIVGMAATPDGNGYWLVASDGGIFAFGDAAFHGSTGAISLNKPIVGMAATPDGNGYWLVASDGGIFNFGDAGFHGSGGNLDLNKPIVGMASTPSGDGYWLVASDGGIFSFGDASFYGSTGNFNLNKPIVGMAPD